MTIELMVVEDDDDVRETFVIVLQEQGFAVTEAKHGQHALDLLRAGARPALIILDQTMPVLSGRGFRAAQLADAQLADIPVLLMTASDAVDDLVQELKPDCFVKKPVGFDHLLATISAVLPAPAPL